MLLVGIFKTESLLAVVWDSGFHNKPNGPPVKFGKGLMVFFGIVWVECWVMGVGGPMA